MAGDELEQALLKDIAAAPDGRRRAAFEALGLPRRDRIDDMWAGSPMRVSEARRLAKWLGYDLQLRRVKDPKDTPAQKPPPERARGEPLRRRRLAS